MLLTLWFAAAVGALSDAKPAVAQNAPATGAPARPEDLRALSDLLAKPEIQAWLKLQGEVPSPAPDQKFTLNASLSSQVNDMRDRLDEVVAAVPELPGELVRLRLNLLGRLQQRPLPAIIVPALVFIALGVGFEWLYRWCTGGLRRLIDSKWAETPGARLRGIGLRILYASGQVLAFATGSIGAFLIFHWEPLLQQIIISYLSAFLIVRLWFAMVRILLWRRDERYRMLPMSEAAARYWLKWSTIIVGVFVLGKFTIDLLPTLQVESAAQRLIAILHGTIGLVLALVALWRAPMFDGSGRVAAHYPVRTWFISIYLVGLWLIALVGTGQAFEIGIVLMALGISLRVIRIAVTHLYRPAAGDKSSPSAAANRPVLAVALERILSACLLIVGALVIADIFGLELAHLAEGETFLSRALRGCLNAAIIALIADSLWHISRAWVERKLAEANTGAFAYGEEARKRARQRTLLPVIWNIFCVVLIVIAGLMCLSALGVEIGPLIAGAGVVGVAVGFGAQTLVKDIISGIFFLFDDAFRAGEYIASGTISGTVEAFSVRSVKLRHHQGALHTIPLGSLSTITNYSRDWVVDNMVLNVAYDTDLEKVRRLIAEIGDQMLAEPGARPHIIEPLRMQGVEEFGQYAIRLSLRMMTKPGEQAPLRRRAYAMIKTAFDGNGVSFAFPTVAQAGSGGIAG